MLARVRSLILGLQLFLLAGMLGCPQGEEVIGPLDDSFREAAIQSLGQRRFVFPAGSGLYDEGDPRVGQSTVVTIGRFNPVTLLAAFSGVTEDGSVEGGYVQLREECVFATIYRALAGDSPITPETEGDVIEESYYDACAIDSEGRLGLYSEWQEARFISEPSERAPVDFSTRVALSSANVGVEPDSSQGAFELTLSAGVMSYAMAAEGPAATTWTAAHVHRGMAGSNGDVWLSLFDEDDPGWYAPLPSPGQIVASAFVTPEQATVLELGNESIYVDAHLSAPTASLGGQIQPPIHPLRGIVASTEPDQRAGIPATDEESRVRTADGAGVIYALAVPGTSAPLSRPAVLSMTPAAAVIGVPASGPSVAAVVLSPEGKRFVAPVELTFTLPDSVDPSSLLAFHYSQDGSDVHFIPLFPGAASEDGVTVSLTHFSTVGLVQGDEDDLSASAAENPSTYEDFQGLMAEELGPAALGQLLGSDSDGLPPDLAARLRGLLKDAVDAVLLPNLRAASTFDELTAALSDIAQWSNDVQQALGSLDGFNAELSSFRSELQGKLDVLLGGLEAACLALEDECDQRDLAAKLSEWHGNMGLLGTLLGDAVSLPPLETFCNGIMASVVNHVDVTPSKLMVLDGGRFELEATPRDWQGSAIDTPVRWSSASPDVAVLDSADAGRGSARSVGTVEIVVSTPEKCDVEGVGVINVRSLSGTWEVRTLSSDHNCAGVSTSPALSIASVTQSAGGSLSAHHPDYGTVTGRVDNLQTVRSGSSPEPYRFTLGPFSSDDTPDCTAFMNDIEEFFSRGEIDICSDTECRPISCVDTETVKGTVGEDGIELEGDNDWTTDEVYEAQLGDPPQWEELTGMCGGTDRIRAVIR